MPLAAGTRIGPYEIVSAIGAGGMGEVYRAHDTRLHRDVAIKILPASFGSDPERRARFEREAQAIAALSHPNVLAIHDTGVHDGLMYVVTELLEGETLAERLKSGALPLRKALDAAVQIARGLAAAHDKHVVHRDLKPENLFLLRDGRVKILDFGLARHVPSASGATETVPAGTDPGVVMGTVGYMAPEQVRGQAVDARADLFAFGTVLYETLTGQRAFRRDTAAETMTAILRDEPPELMQARADLSPALDRIVRHCLEKDPAERFQSARDIAFALESLSGSAPASGVSHGLEKVAGARSSRTLIWIAAGVVAMAAAVFVWSQSRSGRDSVAGESTVAIGAATQVTTDDGLEIDAAISPDGKTLAYSTGTATRMRILIRPVAGGRTITLSDDRDAFEYQPRWSPDGSQILYLTPAGAFVASSIGGTSTRVASSAALDAASTRGTPETIRNTAWGATDAIHSAAWAPDGKRIVLGRNNGLSVVALDGRAEQKLTAVDDPHSCAWSPDDKWIACASGNSYAIVPGNRFSNIAPSSIVLLPTAGGAAIPLTDRTTLNQSPVWAADGRHLYFVSNRQGPRDIYVLEIGSDGHPAGEPRRVSTGLGVHSIGMSAAGQRLTYVTYVARANIWSLPIPTRGAVDTTAAKSLTSGTQIIEAMSSSRDGRWLLYDSNQYNNAEIFRMPIGGGPLERLTTDPADDFCPDLSPDGREIAWHSWRSGTRDIYVRPVSGGALEAVAATPTQESYPSWSPDGLAIAFLDQTIEQSLTRGLFVARRSPSGKWSTPVAFKTGTWAKPAWANGRTIVSALHGGGIVAVDIESRAERSVYVPAGASDPEAESVGLSEDGQHVYFKSHDANGSAAIWTVPLAGGKPRPLVQFNDRPSIRPDFTTGAGRIFFTLEDRQADIWVAELSTNPSR
jgi:eukaryotic-like serine/threonine-protein kinase